jgi:hypothetical protein
MSTWQERLKVAIGPRGYDSCMRRSVQTVLLYESKRCVEPKITALRPFQRKSAHVDQMFALLETLTFLLPFQKEEIMWRTATSKEPINPEIAWKRAKSVDNEMANLAKVIRPLIAAGKTHDETVDLLVQSSYEALTGSTGKAHPMFWEHAHNHVILAFRMYYRYDQLDTTFPDPILPREIIVPIKRERVLPTALKVKKEAKIGIVSNGKDGDDTSVHGVAMLLDDNCATTVIPKSTVLTEEQKMAERRKVLQEVREHLELLKEFEGVVSDEELANRKRELFLALPAAPTISSVLTTPEPNKKFKNDLSTMG